jgi:hypothetical protein
MKHFFRLGLALALYVLAILALRSTRHDGRSEGTEDPALSASPSVTWTLPQWMIDDDRLHWKGTEQRVRYLAASEQDRSRRERALRDMPAARRELQTATLGAWSNLVRSNMPAYHDLYAKAKEAPNGEVLCTICDTLSYMPCIMCRNRDGKCTTCNGSGRRGRDEYCPSCLGTGRCYLCTGSGKMFCPFCDDGMIKVKWPLPHYFPPAG